METTRNNLVPCKPCSHQIKTSLAARNLSTGKWLSTAPPTKTTKGAIHTYISLVRAVIHFIQCSNHICNMWDSHTAININTSIFSKYCRAQNTQQSDEIPCFFFTWRAGVKFVWAHSFGQWLDPRPTASFPRIGRVRLQSFPPLRNAYLEE